MMGTIALGNIGLNMNQPIGYGVSELSDAYYFTKNFSPTSTSTLINTTSYASILATDSLSRSAYFYYWKTAQNTSSLTLWKMGVEVSSSGYYVEQSGKIKIYSNGNFEGVVKSYNILNKNTGESYIAATNFNFKISKNISTNSDPEAILSAQLSGNDNITGSIQSDYLKGFAGKDFLYGGGGGDTLDGGLGNDVINGGDGADTIIGEVGNDSLNGDAGDDLIDGGIGKDILTGGAGADSFKFTTAIKGNIDKITDFARGTDMLVLDHAIFGNLAAGQVSSNNLVSGAAGVKASDSNDCLIFNTRTGALFYDADGSGKGAAIQFATLVGVTDLAASDFLII